MRPRQDLLSNRICSTLPDLSGADLTLRCAWGTANPYSGFESHSLRQLHLTKHSLSARQRAKNFNKHRY